MLCCSCSHVSIIITITIIIIMPMFFLIHVITWEGSQGPQEKTCVILERPKRNVPALTDPSETSLGLDDGHDVRCKVDVYLKVQPQICQLIHDKSNNVDAISIHNMRDHIPVETSNLVLVSR